MTVTVTDPLIYNFTISGRGNRRAIAWHGNCVAVVIELPAPADATNAAKNARNLVSLSTTVRERVMLAFDTLYSTMEMVTLCEGLKLHGGGSGGLPCIESPQDNAGAGGLAHHGVGGLSVGVSVLWALCERASRSTGATLVDHVYFYELGRNFWYPHFNRAFDYYCDDNPSCWGWWTVAFNNLWPIIIPDIADGIELTYFGQSREKFRKGMLNDFATYVRLAAQGRHDFEAWKCSRMPWRKEQSVNNLMTGLLVALYEAYGRLEWIVAFFRELRCAKQVNATNAGGCQYDEIRDNFYIIASKAAQKDLVHVFQMQLKWPLSNSARQEIHALFPNDKPTAPLLSQ